MKCKIMSYLCLGVMMVLVLVLSLGPPIVTLVKFLESCNENVYCNPKYGVIDDILEPRMMNGGRMYIKVNISNPSHNIVDRKCYVDILKYDTNDLMDEIALYNKSDKYGMPYCNPVENSDLMRTNTILYLTLTILLLIVSILIFWQFSLITNCAINKMN